MDNWATKQLSHEGFPLFLRWPSYKSLPATKSDYPTLVVITHEFTHRLPNGLPEPDYNDGLMEIDLEIQNLFEAKIFGFPVLIETFAGKRHYYFYTNQATDVANYLSIISDKYPKEKLSSRIRNDPDWNFYNNYSKQYLH